MTFRDFIINGINLIMLLGLCFITVTGLCFVAGALGLRSCSTETAVPELRIDTVRIVDTIKVEVPTPIRVTVVRRDTIKMSPDTLYIYDDNRVVVLMEQKRYLTKTYDAYVSGFGVALDSIKIFRETLVINNDIPYPVKKRWGLGVQAGVGVGRDLKFTPYIGIGVTYNIFSW